MFCFYAIMLLFFCVTEFIVQLRELFCGIERKLGKLRELPFNTYVNAIAMKTKIQLDNNYETQNHIPHLNG